MFDEIITLKKESTTVDKYGDMKKTPTNRTIFAQVKSVGQSEFYQAQAVGLKPEIKFVIADYLDYEGEKVLSYAPFGKQAEDYTILRTFRTGLNLELVCKRGIE